MANRTIATSDELEASLKYLSPDGNPDTLFSQKLNEMYAQVVSEANDKLYNEVKNVMAGPKTDAISKLRALLG